MTTLPVFGALFLEALVMCVAGPVAVSWRRGPATIVIAGLGLTGLGISWAVSRGEVAWGVLAGCQLLMVAFGLFVLGLARLLHRAGSRGLSPLAALFGLALLASPFLGDPGLEDAQGRVRPAVRTVILEANPMAAMASPELLNVDWLRCPRMYQAVTLGQYHAYQYPHPAGQGLAFFLVGGLLVLLCRVEME